MATTVHLLRHGEVHNPHHVVYARLAGFHLTDRGLAQARAAAAHLRHRPIVAVWSSPLERALETAAVVALPHGLPVSVDERLTEWRLADLWAGVRWEDLPSTRPDQIEAYLRDPTDIPGTPESLGELARRMSDALTDIARAHEGEVVVVGHQDPVQAARLFLTGRDLSGLHVDKPGHAAIIGLEPGVPWRERDTWEPTGQDARPPASEASTSASVGKASSGSESTGK